MKLKKIKMHRRKQSDGGGGEILADACQVIDDPARTEKFGNNIKCPWRNCVHASYATGMFYGIMGDDPNWGYCMAITLPVGAGEPGVLVVTDTRRRAYPMLRYFIETGEGSAMLESFPRLNEWLMHMQTRASARATSFHWGDDSEDGF